MLLEFRTKNYKSFKDELVFSLVPAPKQKGLDYSILRRKIGRKSYKALSSAVIYGPNAAGKTNIIGAMETFKSIILRGNIRNNDTKKMTNTAANSLELIPNCSGSGSDPVDFAIKFIVDTYLVDYSLSLDLGAFLDTEYKREVLFEKLTINDELIFVRNKDLVFGSLENISSLLIDVFEQNAESAKMLAKSNLNNEELFLINGFKNMFSSKLVSIITGWLSKRFTVIYRADTVKVLHKIHEKIAESIIIETRLNEAVTSFGINSNAIGLLTDEEGNQSKLYSIFDEQEKVKAVPADVFESLGTIRFTNMYPFLASTLLSGSTLVIDEFDASIHPTALMNLVNIFHNDEINIHGAQLIFNTHNPIFLNSKLFRRDEIKFVDRDDDTHYSTHYSLSDFGTAGEGGVRKTDDYMKNYFVDRYGAIKDIDFSPVFERLLIEEDEVEYDT